MFDIVIQNGVVIDGDKTTRYRADVGMADDRISAIGDLGEVEARHTIDASGKIVAPGFVDVHNHSDAWLLKTPHLFSKTSQGFTTEVIMADGISYAPLDPYTAHDWIYYLRALNALRYEEYTGWQTLADYMTLLDGRNVQNSIAHIPYANVRTLAAGWTRHAPDDFQMRLMVAEVEKGMEAGAVGVSTGLDYLVQCYASTDELAEACRPLAASGGLYVSHVRYKKGTLAGVQEAVEIGKRAGIPVHISHLKGGTPQETDALLTYIDTVATQEVDFSFDVYPYMPGCTMLNYLLPYEVWQDGPIGVIAHLRRPEIRRRFARALESLPLDATHIAWVGGKENSHYQGRLLSEYVEAVGKSPVDALCDLLIEENLAVLLVFSRGDDAQIEPFLQHDCYMMGTDGIFHEGPPHDTSAVHPRQYGSTARVLGPCVRERQLFSLEEAVHKLSGRPAQRFGLVQRGVLREDWFADIVVFDADTVQDHATYAEPHRISTGVEHVLVNGVSIIRDGQAVTNLPERLPGRALHFKRE